MIKAFEEYSFVMIKPDAIQRGLISKVISAFEDKGLQLVAMKMMQIKPLDAMVLYQEHVNKKFFSDLITFTISNPVIVSLWQGIDANVNARKAVSLIRERFSISKETHNLCHASVTYLDAKREANIFFNDNENCEYESNAAIFTAHQKERDKKIFTAEDVYESMRYLRKLAETEERKG